MATTLAVPVPDLRALDQRYGGTFPADQVASYIDGRNLPDAHGARQMPVWGLIFANTERVIVDAANPQTRIQSLIDYLRTIQYR